MEKWKVSGLKGGFLTTRGHFNISEGRCQKRENVENICKNV